MNSDIIGKRLIYEGDKALKERDYSKATDKYLESEKEGYHGEGESRLHMIANSLGNLEIDVEDFCTETLLDLGEFLLWRGGNEQDEDSTTWAGYNILLQMVPEEKLSRDTKIYMSYLEYLDV